MEQALEMEFCYANPFMQQVFTHLPGTWEADRDHFGHVFIKSILSSRRKKRAMADMRNSMFPVNMKRVRQRDRYMKL